MKRINGNWSKITNPGTLPTGIGLGCAFSPDGSKLAVAHLNSPYITIYNTAEHQTGIQPLKQTTNQAQLEAEVSRIRKSS